MRDRVKRFLNVCINYIDRFIGKKRYLPWIVSLKKSTYANSKLYSLSLLLFIYYLFSGTYLIFLAISGKLFAREEKISKDMGCEKKFSELIVLTEFLRRVET